jgi:hypothetical protein
MTGGKKKSCLQRKKKRHAAVHDVARAAQRILEPGRVKWRHA